MTPTSVSRAALAGFALFLLVPFAGKGEPGGPATASRSHGARPAQKKKPLPKAARQHPYQVGRASWYGEKFHGRLTASGEQFDMFQMTAAHPNLPVGTRLRVTHLRSGRSVVVRVNDRGPAAKTRVAIDLSYAAARALGVVNRGVAWVRLDVVKPEPQPAPVAEPEAIQIASIR